MLGHGARAVIAEPRGHGCAGARNDADDGADNGRHKHRAQHALFFFLRDIQTVSDFGRIQNQAVFLSLRLGHHLHKGKQTDEADREVKPQIQALHAEGQARAAGHRVCADAGDQQTDAGRHHALAQAVAGNSGDDGQAEQTHQKVFCRAEHRGDLGHLRREEEQHQRGENAAEGGGVQRNLQRRLGAPLLVERIAVQHGRRGVRRARRVDEDGADAAAVAACAVNAQQEHHARNRRHLVGKRQEQDDAQNDGQPRNCGEHAANENAQVDPDQVFNRQQVLQSRNDKFKHVFSLPIRTARPGQSGTRPRWPPRRRSRRRNTAAFCSGK